MRAGRLAKRTAAAIGRGGILLAANPSLLARKIIAKSLLALPAPRRPVIRERGGARFEFDCRLDRAVEWMYRGAYEIEVVDAMRRLLRPGGTFIDVGANVGYLSFIAASMVGRGGHVHAFEPAGEYYERLESFARLNPGFDIVTNNTALGDRRGAAEISISNYRNIGWNTMVPGLMERRMLLETRPVPVERLDRYLEKAGAGPVSLIKIDTEGYEFPVLRGLSGYLERSGDRPPIICEINPEAYPRLGRTLGELSAYLISFGYRAYDLIARGREVDIESLRTNANVLLTAKAGRPRSR